MNKLLLTLQILLFFTVCLFAQNPTRNFEINLPEYKIQNSLYHTISYLDSRIDTTHMGIVQLGAFNRKAKVIAKTPLSKQLENVIQSLTDSTATENELLLQLRQFNFAEITGAVSEKGYFYLKAELYAKKELQYQKIASIDTVVLVKAMDVTNALFRNGSKTITDFIAKGLTKTATDSFFYSIHNITQIDSIEKRGIILFNTGKFTDGLYETYSSFKNQAPDKQVIVETKREESISSVKWLDGNGKKVKIKSKDIYAIVYKGQPFIATEYGYYRLTKLDDDFYFTGKAKVTASTGDVIAAGFFFGIIGSLLASNADATFDMKIDHTNGGLIRIREIRTSTE